MKKHVAVKVRNDKAHAFSDRLTAAIADYRTRHDGKLPDRIFISEAAFWQLINRNPELRWDNWAWGKANFSGILVSPFPSNSRVPVFYLAEEPKEPEVDGE